MRTKRPAWMDFVWLGLVVIPIASVLMATCRYGLGVSSDGVFYLSAANNFAAGKGLADFSGRPLVDWPPLLPALLGGLKWITGLDAMTLALALNLLSYAWIFWGAFQLVREARLQTAFWMPVLLAGIAVSSSLIGLASNVGSDILFIAATLTFLVWLMRYFLSQSWRDLLVAALLAAAACLLRYIGASLILVGLATVVIRRWGKWPNALADLFLFGVLSSLPAAAWALGVNYAATGTLVGHRNLATILPVDNLVYSLSRMSQWFLPGALIKQSIVAFFVIALAAVFLLVTKRDAWKNLIRQLFGEAEIVLVLFILIYLAFVISTTFTLDHFESYDDRYQLPALIPLLIVLFFVLEAIRMPRLGKFGVLGLGILFVAWIGYHGFLSFRFVAGSVSEGVIYYNAYNTKALNESDFIGLLKSFDFGNRFDLYSNDPEEVYFFTERGAKRSLAQPAGVEDLRFYLLTDIKSWPDQPFAYLIWFKKYLNRTYVTPHRLEIVSDLQRISTSTDGVLYWISPKPTP